MGPSLRQGNGNGAPDSTRSAGDNGHTTSELQIVQFQGLCRFGRVDNLEDRKGFTDDTRSRADPQVRWDVASITTL
jgi:hypothetical protein